MRFKTLLMTKLLESELSPEQINALPASYQQLGDICLVKLDEKLAGAKYKIAREILKLFPKFRVVCAQGKISGDYRLPDVEVLAGEERTETLHRENEIVYKIDVSRVMFSKGNQEEKRRLAKLVGPREVVVDMFAGIGYFSLPIAKKCPSCQVYATELNPFAHKLLEENIRLNRLTNVIPLKGDCAKILANLNFKADRVLMGLIPDCYSYLPLALKMLKKNGVVHFHRLAREGEELKGLHLKGVKPEGFSVVKQYRPRINHVVCDLRKV